MLYICIHTPHNKDRQKSFHPLCLLFLYVLGYWEENGLLQLLTSLLLLGGFGVRIGDLRQLRYSTRHQHLPGTIIRGTPKTPNISW
jgi:hypothetical protein